MNELRSPMYDCGKGVYTKTVMSRLQVLAPYNDRWLKVAHRLEGRWRKRSGIWSFKRYQYPQVAAALNSIFGTKLVVREVEQDD